MIVSAGGRRIPVSLAYLHDRRGWQRCLEAHCAELKGYPVVWWKNAEPYRVKLVRSLL